MLRNISPSVYWWVEAHGEARGEAYTWNSHLIQIRDAGVMALVDPLPLSDEEIREVERLGRPTHILATCNYHIRESESLRQRWGCKLCLQEEQLGDAEVAIDETFRDGDLLWDLVQVIRVRNLRFPEEVAFLVREDGGLMIVGDAVCGGRKDFGIPEGEIRIPLPGEFFFPAGADEGRKSLRRLLEFRYEKMCFAHGTPVFDSPKEALERFLQDEEYWRMAQERTAGRE